MRIICPSIATLVGNCYTKDLRLFVLVGQENKSSENRTQGDTILKAIYAIIIIPLPLRLVNIAETTNLNTKHSGYADDVTAARKIKDLKRYIRNTYVKLDQNMVIV